ncbi:hypothetical protein BDZ90DRAFT_64325 [Jaminaea rosea]|uniref:Uncharacterized protein n=1 Tax=Jaminaea rosea TaxID=1569628 RepID=A0A316URS7_9BASI|nr:hypothetical protein BDZ90DRAFT_64325 [Jaminaea rosea]PWN25835.1 hypothetical protein BDZ90DRAFT_64325 [Jaminaea rosea]
MSSNIPSSSSSASSAPTIHLPLVAGQSAGPFVLGSSLPRTLAYLRSGSSPPGSVPPNLLFPSVNICYDEGSESGQSPPSSSQSLAGNKQGSSSKPWSIHPASSSTSGGLAPIRIQPCPGVDLIFATSQAGDMVAGAPRLQCIVVSLDDDEEAAGADPTDQQQYHRPISLTYRGQKLEDLRPGRGAKTTEKLTRGAIQQIFGPTYPATRYVQGDGLHALEDVMSKSGASGTSSKKMASNGTTVPMTGSSVPPRSKWMIAYAGLTFVFDGDSSAPNTSRGGQRSTSSTTNTSGGGDVSKSTHPTHLIIHHGDDVLHPTELAWPVAAPQHGEDPAGGQVSLPRHTTAYSARSTEPIAAGQLLLHSARLLPGSGMDLFLLAAPFPPPSTAAPNLAKVELRLGETRTASSSGTQSAGRRERQGGVDVADGINGHISPRRQSNGEHGRAEFWSYPSLGLDLLFYHQRPQSPSCGRRAAAQQDDDDASDFDDFVGDSEDGRDGVDGGAVLAKIVVHSDVPGSALWGRYECVPWYMEEQDQEAGNKARSKRIDRTTPPSQLRSLTSYFPRTKTSSPSTSTHETMHLDRSADVGEFCPTRGTLKLDVRTSLEGFPGAVAEVGHEDGKATDHGQGQGQGEGGVVVAWTIVRA